MFKRLCVVVSLIMSCVNAMEDKSGLGSDTNVIQFKLRKTVRVVLANGHSLVWPTEADQLAPFERSVAAKLYADSQKFQHSLFEQAKIVLSLGNSEEQVQFCKHTIAQLAERAKSVHPTGHIESRDCLVDVLLRLTLFCEMENAGKGAQGIWGVLLAKKNAVDRSVFTEFSTKDTLLLYSMLNKARCYEECNNRVGCKACLLSAKRAHIAEYIVDRCCKEKINLGKACDRCAKRIKQNLYIKIKMIAFGLHHFGVACLQPEHKELLSWADITPLSQEN